MTSKTEDTRELILRVAIELFIKKGYKSVTMSDLEHATGLTKGAFYHHFKDKVEIFEAAIKRIVSMFRLNLDLEKEKQLSLQAFMKIYIAHTSKNSNYLNDIAGDQIAHAQLGNLIADIYAYIPDFFELVSDVLKEESAHWERILSRAKENKEIRADVDLTAITQLFLNIPDCIERNRMMGKTIQYSLIVMSLQYEQLYALIKL